MRTQIDQDGDPVAEALGRVYLYLLELAARNRRMNEQESNTTIPLDGSAESKKPNSNEVDERSHT